MSTGRTAQSEIRAARTIDRRVHSGAQFVVEVLAAECAGVRLTV
jgi:hypothetical protein